MHICSPNTPIPTDYHTPHTPTTPTHQNQHPATHPLPTIINTHPHTHYPTHPLLPTHLQSPDPNPNSERPSLQELRKLNIDPSAYHTLGNELLTADTMAEIDSSNPTTALDEILRNWQQGDQATWETLATALDKIGQNEKAADARLQYQCS